jgi:pilus assembly protein Flp/PilA
MKTLLARFLQDRSGATSIEYALIASSISIVIIGAATGVGATVTNKYSAVSSALR